MHNRSQIAEKIFFFPGSGNRNLLGFLHNSNSSSNTNGIVYCHPFAEEKNMSHPIVVKTARKFAEAGFPVFRFDLSGCGDSEGDLEFSSIEDWLQDFHSAIKVFQKETGISNFFLWGLRLGAGLCLLQQQFANEIAGLVLWQPVLDFSLHIKQFMRRKISFQISNGMNPDKKLNNTELQYGDITNINGYPISKHLYESFISLSSQPKNISSATYTLILSMSLMDQPSFGMKQYAEHLNKAGTPVILKHVQAEPFWDRYWQWECREPANITLQWLNNSIR